MLEKYLIEADMCYLNKQHLQMTGYFDDFIDVDF